MNKKRLIIGGAVIVALVIIIIIVTTLLQDTSLEFSLVDKCSGAWVYNSTIRLQDRVIRGFKQNTYTFTGLKPGNYEMEISAPFYESKKVFVNIKQGSNRLGEPIFMSGIEIPGIKRIAVQSSFSKPIDLKFELRLIGENGHGIENHPCVDIRLIMYISEQLDSSGNGFIRGPKKASDILNWIWDNSPNATYKYNIIVPENRQELLKEESNLVIDFLLLVPKPGKISSSELTGLSEELKAQENILDVEKYIQREEDRIDYYYYTIGNK